MVIMKFSTEKLDDRTVVLVPTIVAEFTKRKIMLGLLWMCGAFGISIEWSKKAKIAANENKNK